MKARTLTCLSPAKLNLFLHVTGRRENGYHDIQTLFQLLDWGDTMTFTISSTPGVRLARPIPGIAEDQNLILRAAGLLAANASLGVTIGIEKRIPMGGGLGGGSSNAATTLLALNQLWELGHSERDLMRLGLELGADVPVFVQGSSAWAEGLGEVLTPVELPPRWYVILSPRCHVSTAEIFAAPELTRNTAPITMSAFFAGEARNDLQQVVTVRHPEVRNALITLEKSAPAMMTGSGACVFASAESEHNARAIADTVPQELRPVVAAGIKRRPSFVASDE
ncbi:MAG: 4-(cytidine 5'-diphospho)-2-C-methyl-D-erythritol kinase [Cellvibrionales bacterium]|jgi:4-diphosphocytidyl-2-C-methyl-D-erythritol kinase